MQNAIGLISVITRSRIVTIFRLGIPDLMLERANATTSSNEAVRVNQTWEFDRLVAPLYAPQPRICQETQGQSLVTMKHVAYWHIEACHPLR
jgi:hypothetical protein